MQNIGVKKLEEVIGWIKPERLQCYLTLRKDNCQLKLNIGNIAFSWTFSSTIESRELDHDGTSQNWIGWYPEEKNVEEACDMFEHIKVHHNGVLHYFAIGSELLMQSKRNVAQCINRFITNHSKCDIFRLCGHNKYDDVNNEFFRSNLEVSDYTHITLLSQTQTVSEQCIKNMTKEVFNTAKLDISLPGATPSLLFPYLARHTTVSVDTFPLKSVNEFIHLWLISENSKMERFIMRIKNPERTDIDQIFAGLMHVETIRRSGCTLQEDGCGFLDKCDINHCEERKSNHLQNSGIRLIRHDGVQAIVFYSVNLPEFTFVMVINDPGPDRIGENDDKQYKTTVIQSEEQEKQIKELEAEIDDYEKKNNMKGKQKEPRDSAQKSGERKNVLSKIKLQDLEWEYYNTQSDISSFLRIEVPVQEKREERQKYGYFVLPSMDI